MPSISGVPTSVAAFAGWASQGPTDEAVLVTSWSAFVATYGGLAKGSFLGYAVSQFFENGGQQAYVIRVAWDSNLKLVPSSGTPLSCETASALAGGTLTLWARNPGAWANGLQLRVTLWAGPASRFDLQVLNAAGQLLEEYQNVSVSPSDPQYVVSAVDTASTYVTFANPAGSATAPPAMPTVSSTVSLAGGADGSLLAPATDGNFEVALGASPLAAGTYGVTLLDGVAGFNLLCVPGETDAATIAALQTYCASKRAFLIVDAPLGVTAASLSASGPVGTVLGNPGGLASVAGQSHQSNSAYYVPWVQAPDPLANGAPALFPPCGFVAGIYAATDAARGVWKAPAGMDAILAGASGLQYELNDAENAQLDPLAIDCLRTFQNGSVVWGARTLAGSDEAGSQWKYVPVRRLALYVESSLASGLQWVEFEPNDEQLWGQIRLSVAQFMQGLFLAGALQGQTPASAFFVKCDSGNNPPASVAQGIVNILVGFAPLEPAEFVIVQIQQLAGCT